MLSIISSWATFCTIGAEKTFAFFAGREPIFTDSSIILLLIGFYLLISGGAILIGIGWFIFGMF
jgi:hypothetical protein